MIRSKTSKLRWFVDALTSWMTESPMIHWFIWFFQSLVHWLLVPWFNDSLILWIVGSLTHSVDCDSWFHWLVALLTHWVVEPLVHCDLFLYCFIESLNSDTDSLIPWFIASLPLSFSCAVILSRNFIGIWATICSLLVSFISFILSFFHPFILSSLRYCALSCFMRFFHFIPPCDFTSLDFISCHVIQSFTGLLLESLNRWTNDSLIHWLIASLWWSGSMIRWFVDALIRWMTENHRWFIDLFDFFLIVGSLTHWFPDSQWLTDSLNRWFVDSLGRLWFMISLARGATDSLSRWTVGSLWFVSLLFHWVVEFRHWFTDPLVHCFIASFIQLCSDSFT